MCFNVEIKVAWVLKPKKHKKITFYKIGIAYPLVRVAQHFIHLSLNHFLKCRVRAWHH